MIKKEKDQIKKNKVIISSLRIGRRVEMYGPLKWCEYLSCKLQVSLNLIEAGSAVHQSCFLIKSHATLHKAVAINRTNQAHWARRMSS